MKSVSECIVGFPSKVCVGMEEGREERESAKVTGEWHEHFSMQPAWYGEEMEKSLHYVCLYVGLLMQIGAKGSHVDYDQKI